MRDFYRCCYHHCLPVLLFMIFSAGPTQAVENKACFKCHNMATLAVRSERGLQNFHVSKKRFEHSEHGSLNCTSCHSGPFTVYPHRGEQQSTNCVECHSEHPGYLKGDRLEQRKQILAGMLEKEKEFKKSIHHKNLSDDFTCGSCHNLHTFEAPSETADLKSRIQYSKDLCLQCHADEGRINALKTADYSYRPLDAIHAWLPSQKHHFDNLRCVDCHSSYQNKDDQSHLIVKKEKAVRSCTECHSTQSILTAKLYQMRAKDERRRYGLVNQIIWNDSYIIGATRNIYLDIASGIFFGLGLSGIAVHAGLRYRSRKKQKEKDR